MLIGFILSWPIRGVGKRGRGPWGRKTPPFGGKFYHFLYKVLGKRSVPLSSANWFYSIMAYQGRRKGRGSNECKFYTFLI